MPQDEQRFGTSTGEQMVHFSIHLTRIRTNSPHLQSVKTLISLVGNAYMVTTRVFCLPWIHTLLCTMHASKKTFAHPCVSRPIPLTFLLFWDDKHSGHSLWRFPCGWWTQTAHILFKKYKWDHKCPTANIAIWLRGNFLFSTGEEAKHS